MDVQVYFDLMCW